MSISAASLILVPLETTELELVGTAGSDPIHLTGLNLPIPAITNEFASSPDTEGGRRTRTKADNSDGSLTLRVSANDMDDFWAAVALLQETVAALHREGGSISYTPPDGAQVAYDVEAISITGLPTDPTLALGRCEPEITFTCLPFARLVPADALTAQTGSDPINGFEIPATDGSAEALARLTIADLASVTHDWVEYGIEEDYDSAIPVPLLLTADTDLSATGFAGSSTTRAGAYSTGHAVKRGSLLSYPQAICTTGNQKHIGPWRPFVRVYGAGSGPIYVRLSTRIGGGTRRRMMEHGDWIAVPQLGAFCEVDLGVLEIDEALVGTQGWEGWIEAYTETIGDTLDVDYLGMMPASKYGLATLDQQTEYSSAPSAHDEFDQSTGDLTLKALPDGSGVWTGTGGGGTDFTVNATDHVAQRVASGDPALGGRYVLAPPTLTACVLRGDVLFTGKPNGALALAGIARYTDTDNWLRFVLAPYIRQVVVQKRVGGTFTTLGITAPSALYKLPNVWYSAIISIDENGNWKLQGGVKGSGFADLLEGQDAALATGGALASGKVGLYDKYEGSSGVVRQYDNVIAFPGVAARHILNADKQFVIDADHADTESVSSTVWTPTTIEGVYPRLVPGKPTRLAVRARRKNTRIATATNVTDEIQVDLEATPRVHLLG
jgi:hypothetical protein